MKKRPMEYIPVWSRYLEMFREGELTKDQVGELLIAMMEYQFEGRKPDSLTPELRIFWLFIREDLDRALLKYEQAVENGKKGGRPRKKPEETPDKPAKPRTGTKTTSTTESTSASKTKASSSAGGGEDLSVCTKAYGEFGWVCLRDDQYRKLEAMMGTPELLRCIAYIDRSAQTTNNRNQWQDWALVLRRCYEERWHDLRRKTDPVPMGASGSFGQAELEAIQRVLHTDLPELPGYPDPEPSYYGSQSLQNSS